MERFDTSEHDQGYVETNSAGGYTHSWISFEVGEFSRGGNVRRKVRIRLSLFDAAQVAGLFQKALILRDGHTSRLRGIAEGTGY